MFALITIFVASILAALSMMAGHYVAPRLFGRDLHQVAAYVWGCSLGIFLPFLGWCLFWLAFHDNVMAAWLPAVALLFVMAGAGAGTVAAYVLDAWTGYRAGERMGGDSNRGDRNRGDRNRGDRNRGDRNRGE